MSTLLVCVDFSNVTSALIEAAERQSRALGADVVLLHVAPQEPDFVGFEVGPEPVRHIVAQRLREEHRQVQQLADALRARGIEAQGLLVMGSVVDKTLEQARRLHAEMILMGSHGHSAIYDLLVGSATESVLRHADRPVLVVPARGR